MQPGVVSLVPEGDQRDVADRHRHGGEDVRYGADEGDIRTPVVGEVDCDTQDRERHADPERPCGETPIKLGWSSTLDDVGPEEADADQHRAEGPHAEVGDEGELDVLALCDVFVGPVVAEVTCLDLGLDCGHRQGGECETDAANDEEGPGRTSTKKQEHRRADRVEHEHVAEPEGGMHETDPEQEGVAPQAEPVRPATFGRSPVGEDDDARAEQHREHRHRLLIDEYLTEDPHNPVEGGVGAGVVEVEVRRLWQTERHGVHHEDAERGDATNGVEIGDPFGSGDRRCGIGHVRSSPIHLGSCTIVVASSRSSSDPGSESSRSSPRFCAFRIVLSTMVSRR